MKKRLIERNLSLAGISEETAREKNIGDGHSSTPHIWWRDGHWQLPPQVHELNFWDVSGEERLS